MLCLLLALGGCADYYAKLAAERAAQDDAKCLSYGAQRGDPAYVGCRAQLDAARTQAQATAANAPYIAPPQQQVQVYQPGQLFWPQ